METIVQCGFCEVWGSQAEIYQHLQDDHPGEEVHETEELNGIDEFEPVPEEAAAAAAKNGKLEWDNNESTFLMVKYNEYVTEVGIHKMFRSKKCMYKRIASDLKNELQIERTWEQCENRYKTIKRRKKRDYNNKPIQLVGRVIDTDFDDPESTEHANGEIILEDGTRLPKRRKEDEDYVTATLKELYRKKEASKQQRHTERLELFSFFCKSFLEQESGEGSRENGQVLFDKEHRLRKKALKKSEKSITEVLLEIHEKKEQNKERRHKEKLNLLNKFYSEFLARITPNTFEAIVLEEPILHKSN